MDGRVVDVAVVGAGPAGTTIARMLAARGLEVTLLGEDRPARLRSREVMSPQCRQAIAKWLPPGVLDSPVVASSCAGIQSRWAGDGVDYEAYRGQAALIDRNAFDKILTGAAGVAGVGMERGCRVERIVTAPTHGTLSGTRAGAPWSLDARFIVEATGRSRRIARLLGVARHRLTHQVALVGHARGDPSGRTDDWFRVERSQFGWWSAVNLPKNSWEIVFYHQLHSPRPAAHAISQLFRSTRLSQEVGEYDLVVGGAGRGADAGFSALEIVQGPRWLAVGDAAVAFDPVSSQGLWHAIGSAHAAALAIDEYLMRGTSNGLAEYAFRTFATLRHHAGRLRHHYEGMP